MLAFFEYIFSDFWRFLMLCVLLAIATYFKPVEIKIFKGDFIGGGDKDDAS